MFNQRISKTGLILLLCASWAAQGRPHLRPQRSTSNLSQNPPSSASPRKLVDGIRESSVSVRVVISGAAAKFSRPIEIYACLATEEGLRSSATPSTLPATSLRIRNDRGEWVSSGTFAGTTRLPWGAHRHHQRICEHPACRWNCRLRRIKPQADIKEFSRCKHRSDNEPLQQVS